MHATYGGYLTKDGMCAGLRVVLKPSKDVSLPRSMRDTLGYYADDHGDTTFAPCLARLPHGRFLAGWTMGEGMYTTFFRESNDSERDAWMAAHEMAQWNAEQERDYQSSLCRECFGDDDVEERDDVGTRLCGECYRNHPERILALHSTE